MVKIGYPADPHYPESDSEVDYESNVSYLYNTVNTDIAIWGGDQMNGAEDEYPHFTEQELRDFWNMVERAAGTLENTYAVPGNHDIPVPKYEEISREYIGSRADTPQKIEPVDGVTCLMIDTQGPGSVQGGYGGVGLTTGYVPYRQLVWLRDELQAAHSRGDICLVFGHSPVWFADSSTSSRTQHPVVNLGGSIDARREVTGYATEEGTIAHSYFVAQNYHRVREVLEANGPAIYFSGHDYADYFGAELVGNGFYHCWQEHYYNDQNELLSYVEADPSTGQVDWYQVDPNAATETNGLSVAPNW